MTWGYIFIVVSVEIGIYFMKVDAIMTAMAEILCELL